MSLFIASPLACGLGLAIYRADIHDPNNNSSTLSFRTNHPPLSGAKNLFTARNKASRKNSTFCQMHYDFVSGIGEKAFFKGRC